MPVPNRGCCLVDLSAIRDNVARLAGRAGDAAICAVVKADGYGHGMVPAARAARAGGAEWLAVAFVEEALALRAAGVGGRLLAVIALPGGELTEAVSRSVDLGVGSARVLDAVAAAARAAGTPARVHLEADTGLGRGGAGPTDWPRLVEQAAKFVADGAIELAGVWSHLAFGETPGSPVTAGQIDGFRQALAVAERAGLTPEVRHLANSGGLFTAGEARYDMVRTGIAVYGLTPGPILGSSRDLGLRPAMTVRAELAMTKRVPAGQGVSYGHTYTTGRESTLALVPLGYGDGIPRAAGNRAEVSIGGHRHRISGTVCMDQFVVDVGDAAVRDGEEVVLFGPGDDGEPTADEWAAATGTIGYEIVTRIGPRLVREYVGGET